MLKSTDTFLLPFIFGSRSSISRSFLSNNVWWMSTSLSVTPGSFLFLETSIRTIGAAAFWSSCLEVPAVLDTHVPTPAQVFYVPWEGFIKGSFTPWSSKTFWNETSLTVPHVTLDTGDPTKSTSWTSSIFLFTSPGTALTGTSLT